MKKRPSNGLMRHTATLLKRTAGTSTRGDRGQNTTAYAPTSKPIPCRFETLSGLELIRAKKREATATHRVTAWNTSTIKPDDRLLIGALTLEIRAVIPTEDETQIEILCASEVP